MPVDCHLAFFFFVMSGPMANPSPVKQWCVCGLLCVQLEIVYKFRDLARATNNAGQIEFMH